MSQQTVLIKITSNFSIYEGKELGAGHYGRVFKGYHDQERKDVAVKIIQKEMLQKNQGLFVREIQVLIKLNSEVTHPNVVGLLGYTKKDEIGYLFFELCKDNLQNRLFNSLTEKEVIPYFKDILSGLVFLHSKQIIHRDLKPQNILIDDRDTLKIADFGLSRQFDPSNQLKMTDRVGNYAYQAPEVKTSHYDQRCDVWSLGLILYQLLTGTLCREYSIDSHQGIDKRNMDIKQKKFNLKFEGYEPIWERLLNKMLVYEYTNRPTSKQILDEFLHWEKQYNKPKTLFKTFAQYEDNIEQMRKTMRLEKKKTSERIKQEQKKQKFQQKPLNPPQKQSETEIMILSLRDEQYDSLVNFVSYLDYYHQYKIISQVIQCKIMQLVKSSPSLKQIYNSFSILTISFLMDTIVYLRYKQLLIEMNNLFMDHPDLKNQYNQIDAQKRIRFDRFVAQKKDKFNKFIIMFQTESSEKIKKRISYRQKIKLNENYISIFKFLEGIKIKQQPYESIIHHLQLFFIDPQFHFDETSFKTCSLEQLKMIYLFKKLHEVCQQMSGSFHMKTSLQLKNIRRGLENISIQSIQKYLANPEQ